jgi:hypothetical protein
MKAQPKWFELLVLFENKAAADAVASTTASASDQSADAPALAAGSETSAEAAVAGREPGGATDHGAKPDGAGAGTGQTFDDAELAAEPFIHGEWFHHGQRMPGDDRSLPLPEDFAEKTEVEAPFPEMKGVLEVTDGAPTQFAYKDNLHQTAEWRQVGLLATPVSLGAVASRDAPAPRDALDHPLAHQNRAELRQGLMRRGD